MHVPSVGHAAARGDPTPVHIIRPGGRRTPAKLRAFVDMAAERLRASPDLA